MGWAMPQVDSTMAQLKAATVAPTVQLTWKHAGIELRGQFDELCDADGRFSNVFISSREIFAGAAYTIAE
jgi:hypothetical protein